MVAMNLNSFEFLIKMLKDFLQKRVGKIIIVSAFIVEKEKSIGSDVLDTVVADVVVSFLILQDDGLTSFESQLKIGFG